MAKISRENVLEYIEEASMMDIADLVKDIETKFGVTAAAPVAVAAAPADAKEEAAEQTEFDVVLSQVGSQKIQVIKVVRSLTELGLKEAKDLVDGAPATVREQVSKAEADEMKEKLEGVGATVEVK